MTDVLLLPEMGGRDQRTANDTCLIAAETAQRQVFVAALLPQFSTTAAGRPVADLWPSLRVTAKVFESDIKRGFRRFRFAAEWWKTGGEVLLVEVADAQQFGKGYSAVVQDFALIPLAPGFAPVPSADSVQWHLDAMNAGECYAVGPQDDSLLHR